MVQKTDVFVNSVPLFAHTLMNQGMAACFAVSVEDSERAKALRLSSPFAGILNDQERFTFLKTWQRQDTDEA